MNEHKFISDHECQELTNLSRTTIYRMRRDGKFPQMLRLSAGRKAFRLSEVLEWMSQRATI